jgi:hypothetical protein
MVIPRVVAWRHRKPGRPAIGALLERVEDLGWLRNPDARVVVQVGPARPSPIAVETAGALIDWLREQNPPATVEVLDCGGFLENRDGVRRHDLRMERTLQVAGVAAARGLVVPALWFESFFLITVAGCGPSPATRVTGVLEAQAGPLLQVGNSDPLSILAYEAHRLAPSDLAVVCGHAGHGGPGSEAWWIVSPSDVAAEQALARACGIPPASLPLLRGLSQHELLTPEPEPPAELPRLRSLPAPAWQASACASWAVARAVGRSMALDVRGLRRNVRRIPGFVQRRAVPIVRRLRTT